MKFKIITKFSMSISAIFTVLFTALNISPASAFVGTLENGNLAYAAGSGFDKGEACNYLPGFETGYDAWHFVLTSRGATFQQSSTNPAVSINLNFVFMRQNGVTFVIQSGAWVQTGKGAYVYTPVADRIRMVQTGSVSKINGLDSGMRLSHTCPGSGSVTTTSTPSPTPTTSTTPTPTPTPSASTTPTPTPTPTSTRSATPPSTPTPTSTTSPTVIPTLRPKPSSTASAIQVHATRPPVPKPTGSPCACKTPSATVRNPIPTPTPTQQGIVPAPTPTPSATPSSTKSPVNPNPSEPPIVLPTPPTVEDPKEVIYVEPETPKVIPPEELPSPPTGEIEIVIPPKYGKLDITPTGQITYTPNQNNPTSPTVDVIEFKYTNLSGEVVVVRKEFVVTQKGDVPRIIQTGYEIENSGLNYLGLVLLLPILLLFIRLFRGVKRHG